ncbi:hypothetical protein [Actinomyces procaprae]|uniref:hypothetical protein n=1 Tax=Actinomyces procaprae TaxID=2560010 RepID=UPI0010A2A80C|nr:hypothetical protein [Actinomyces procaprae]
MGRPVKDSPTMDLVLAAVADGNHAYPALERATGRTRKRISTILSRLRGKGLITGTASDGSVRVTDAGRRMLAGDRSAIGQLGRCPTTAHLVLSTLAAAGPCPLGVLVDATGVRKSAVRACLAKLRQRGRLSYTGGAYALTGQGRALEAEYTAAYGTPPGLPTNEQVSAAWRAEQDRREERAGQLRAARAEQERRRATRKAAKPKRRRAKAAKPRTVKRATKPAAAPAAVASSGPVRLGPIRAQRRRPLPTEGWVR